MQEQEKKAFCPECELREMQSKITEESIALAISKMAYVEGISSPKEEYERRMSICKDCKRLEAKIMCMECGSYVAFRAISLAQKCPFPGYNKWEK